MRLLLHCTSDDDGTSDDYDGSSDDEQAFPNIGTIMYIQNAGSNAIYSICCQPQVKMTCLFLISGQKSYLLQKIAFLPTPHQKNRT